MPLKQHAWSHNAASCVWEIICKLAGPAVSVALKAPQMSRNSRKYKRIIHCKRFWAFMLSQRWWIRHAILFFLRDTACKTVDKVGLQLYVPVCSDAGGSLSCRPTRNMTSRKDQCKFSKTIFPLLVRGNHWFGYFLFVCVW